MANLGPLQIEITFPLRFRVAFRKISVEAERKWTFLGVNVLGSDVKEFSTLEEARGAAREHAVSFKLQGPFEYRIDWRVDTDWQEGE